MSEAQVETRQMSESETMRLLSIFALVRTALSSERSLLSWIRTSVSLYTLGFSITKFIDYMGQRTELILSTTGPRRLGLALISLSLLSLGLGLAEYLKRMRKMKQLGLPGISRFFVPIVGAVVLLAVSVATLIGIAADGPS